MSKKKEYAVGYGKPPKSTQFKKGQSGNPKGRPKGIRNLNSDVESELNEKLLVTEGGKTLKTTKQRAMIKTLFAKALKGDTRASTVLINLILGLEQSRIANDAIETISNDDLAILNAFRDKVLSDSQGGQES